MEYPDPRRYKGRIEGYIPIRWPEAAPPSRKGLTTGQDEDLVQEVDRTTKMIITLIVARKFVYKDFHPDDLRGWQQIADVMAKRAASLHVPFVEGKYTDKYTKKEYESLTQTGMKEIFFKEWSERDLDDGLVQQEIATIRRLGSGRNLLTC